MAEEAADKQERTKSRQVVRYVREGLKRDGALPEFDEGAD